jgi:hypothetical protein
MAIHLLACIWTRISCVLLHLWSFSPALFCGVYHIACDDETLSVPFSCVWSKSGMMPTLPIPPTTHTSPGACSAISRSLYHSWYASRFMLRCIISYLLPRKMCLCATNCAVLHISVGSRLKLKYEVEGHLQGNFCWSMGTWLKFFITRVDHDIGDAATSCREAC